MINHKVLEQKTKNDEAEKALEIARHFHEDYLIMSKSSDLKKAIDYYIRTIKLNPQKSETYYRLASLLWEDGQIGVSSAIEQCKMAISLDPKNYNARIYTGYFLTIAGEMAEAEKELKTAIKINPLLSARPRLMIAFMMLQKLSTKKIVFDDFSKCVHYFFTGSLFLIFDFNTLKMLYKNFVNDFSIFVYQIMGMLFKNCRNYDLAIKTWDNAAQKTSNSAKFYERIADTSLKQNNPSIALANYKKAHNAAPNDVDILIKLTSTLQSFYEENYEEIIDCYNKLIKLEPENHRAYYELGHLYIQKRDNLNAVSAFKLALGLDEHNPYYHNSYAYSLVQLGQYDDAIEHYQEAINNNPDSEWTSIVCQSLGTLFHQVKENYEAALAVFQTALVLNPNSADVYISIGEIYYDMGDLDNAIKHLCDAVKYEPNNPKIYSKLAVALWEKDYVEEAIIAYHKTIELVENCEQAYNNLGVIYLDGVGSPKEALDMFEKAININRNYTLAYFNAGRAAQSLGDIQMAASHFNMALNLNKLTNDLSEREIRDRLYSLFEA